MRQLGVRYSKYVIVFNPLIYRSRDLVHMQTAARLYTILVVKVDKQIKVRDFKYAGKIGPLRACHVIWRMRSHSKHIFSGGLWELVTQKQTGIGSSTW